MYIDNPSYFGDHYFDENGDDVEDEFIMLNIEKKIQTLLEINIEVMLYLFLNVLLIIHYKHH